MEQLAQAPCQPTPKPRVETYLDTTVIIPTLNEGRSIGRLLDELSSAYPKLSVIIADDSSSDGTIEIVKAFKNLQGHDLEEVQLIERGDDCIPGLTASVIDGIRACKTQYFVVMDGDLQHPPEIVSKIVTTLRQGADLAIGKRLPYREEQPFHRVAFTRFATALARTALSLRGVHVSDPMSGLFGGQSHRTQTVLAKSLKKFELRGYKILFDLLRILPCSMDLREVPYHFQLRAGGHSKLQAQHGWFFIRSLFR